MAHKHAVGAWFGGRVLILRKTQEFRWSFGQKKSYNGRRLLAQSYCPCVVTATSPHCLCMEPTLAPYNFRAETAETAQQLHCIAQFPNNLRTASIWLCPACRQVPNTSYCMMPEHIVNAYAVARSHLPCLKNCMKNHRPIYRMASNANVN